MNISTNGNTSQVANDRLPPGFYIMKAKTKARQGLDGVPNRGILLYDASTGTEQWVSIPSSNEVCRANWGSKVYYHGHGNSPTLSFTPDASPHFDNGGVNPNQFNEPSEPTPTPTQNSNIDEHLLEQLTLVLSNAVNLMSSMAPQLSEESIVKMAISASISYQQIVSRRTDNTF